MSADPPPARFTPGLFRFLRELRRHNNRPWFLKNKARFDRDVLGACVAFVTEVAPGVGRINSHLVADARPAGGSVMRIYRDVRFSKDKSPYRTSMGIHFFYATSAGHDGGLPGFFLHLAPGESFVAAGMWMPAPPELARIRSTIARDPTGWAKVKHVGLSPDPSALKRVPPGFDPAHPMADDLKRKSFVAAIDLADSDVTRPGFPNRFLAACRRLDPLNGFLAQASGVPY